MSLVDTHFTEYPAKVLDFLAIAVSINAQHPIIIVWRSIGLSSVKARKPALMGLS